MINVFKNFFRGKKLNANEVVVLNDNNKAKTLDKLNYSIEQTANGFVIKFASGFMIQTKEVFDTPSGASQNNSAWTATLNLGNWDVPFKTFLYGHASISKMNGARGYWLTCYAHNNSPSATACGVIAVNDTWNGFSNKVGVLSIGFGFWK